MFTGYATVDSAVQSMKPIGFHIMGKSAAAAYPRDKDCFLRRQLFFFAFCHSFRGMRKVSSVKPVRLPSRSPNLNAYAERWIGSIRRECFAKVIPLGERHLRQIVHEYVVHHHEERNHQGLGNQLISPANHYAATSGRIVRRPRLGGVLNYYHREAA